MLRHLFRGLCTRTSGRVLVAGAIGVLAGVEHLMSSRPKGIRISQLAAKPQVEVPPVRSNYFQIRRTVSELGYKYWVLQGFGTYQSFALFDTWQEAMDAAMDRLSTGIEAEDSALALVESGRF